MTPGWGGGALVLVAGALWLLSLRTRIGPRVGLAVALLLRLPFLFLPLESDDVYRYVWEGRIQHEGFSPYEYAPQDKRLAHLRKPTHDRINHPDLATVYPPLAQMVFSAATSFGLQERGLAKLILVLDMVVVVLLFLWLRSRWLIVYAWCPLAVAGPVGGHMDPLMLLLLVGCAWAWDRRRFLEAGALLGGAILAKGVVLLLLPWLAVRRPRAALAALLVVLLGYLPYGVRLGSLFTFATTFSFNASLYSLLGPSSVVVLALWVVLVTLSQPRIASAGAMLLAGLLILSPTVHFWYLSWFLVLLPAVGPRRWTEPLLLWCVTIAATYPTYALMPPFREFRSLTLLEYAAPVLYAFWLLWRHWPRRVPAREPRPGPARRHGVVIPCRGEAENLRALLPRFGDAAQVVVADTPTADGTRELCARFPNVTYLEVPTPGYGAAVAAGLRALEGVEFGVVCDADHALGPEQVPALLQPFEQEDVGLVAAARCTRLPLAQRLGNGLATFLIALGWGRRFNDLGPFRALRFPFFPLEDRGFGFNVEMNVRALERGSRVVEVSLPAAVRTHGTNRISGTLKGVVGAGFGILRQLYRLREQSCRPRLSS